MSINKNKSEIVESFKNLLKKADEVKGLNENINETENINVAKKVKLVKIDSDIKRRSVNNFERLGIKNIKRLPDNPFQKKYKEENKEQFEKYEYEASTKITNILNKHIYHWLNREMPKFSRVKLRKHIYNLLSELVK
tara:strand:+ start:428 stop:838 length:411 start_codon:yes stop_codon:yes gene_type:complete